MNLEIDADVLAVASFMQSRVPASRLASVGAAISQLAPILWGRYRQEKIEALALVPISENGTSQLVATGCGPVPPYAGGGSAAVGDAALPK